MGPASALGHGAIVVAEGSDGTAFVAYSYDDSSQQEARNEAAQLCEKRKNTPNPCRIIADYADTCVGFARAQPYTYLIKFANDTERADLLAFVDCKELNRRAGISTDYCAQHRLSYCDHSPLISTSAPALSPSLPSSQSLDDILRHFLSLQWLTEPDRMTSGDIVILLLLGAGVFVGVVGVKNQKMPPYSNTIQPGSSTTVGPQASPVGPFFSEASDKGQSTSPNNPSTVSEEPVIVPPAGFHSSPHAETPSSQPSPPPPESSQTAPPSPAPSISDPLEGIVLKIRKATKDGAFGAIIYMIDARLDASATIRAQIARHRLGGRVIYESTARQKHAHATRRHLDSTRGQPVFAPADQQVKGVLKTFWGLGRAAVSATITALSLRITVDSLLAGVHIECKDMDEFAEAEQALVEAKQNLEGYIAHIATFDGQERII
jgi:hypothetical protein